MKFRLEFTFVYFSNLWINNKLLRELDGLVVSRTIVQLCYGYLWVALGSKGLKLILLSIKDDGLYENSYTLGGGPWPPRPPTKSAPVSTFDSVFETSVFVAFLCGSVCLFCLFQICFEWACQDF